ncbi:MAG: DMT family transporter [Gammaproteobacteria bacterium]
MSIHVKLAIATVLWAGTPTIGRVLAPYEAPEIITFGRFVAASIFLYWAASRTGNLFARAKLRDVPLYLALGLTGICLHNIFMFWGLEYADATRGSIIMGFISIMVAVMEFLFYGIRISRLALCGITLGFAGLAFVISEGSIATLVAGEIGFGDLLLLGSAFGWAIYSVLARPALLRVSALDLTAFACITGTVLLIPMVLQDYSVAAEMLMDPTAVALILISGLLGTGFGYIWYYEGVQILGSVGTVMYVNLIPIIGVVIAGIALNEIPSLAATLGGILVVLGVVLVNKQNGLKKRS